MLSYASGLGYSSIAGLLLSHGANVDGGRCPGAGLGNGTGMQVHIFAFISVTLVNTSPGSTLL